MRTTPPLPICLYKSKIQKGFQDILLVNSMHHPKYRVIILYCTSNINNTLITSTSQVYMEEVQIECQKSFHKDGLSQCRPRNQFPSDGMPTPPSSVLARSRIWMNLDHRASLAYNLQERRIVRAAETRRLLCPSPLHHLQCPSLRYTKKNSWKIPN